MDSPVQVLLVMILIMILMMMMAIMMMMMVIAIMMMVILATVSLTEVWWVWLPTGLPDGEWAHLLILHH